jgi:hypothetical protein
VTSRDAIVEAARDAIGTRFRHRGRNLRGLDCVGLVLFAYDKGAHLQLKPGEYKQRGETCARAFPVLEQQGFHRIERGEPGDVLLLMDGEISYLAIVAEEGTVIFASMRSRKVVERHISPADVIVASFRHRSMEV